MTDIATIRSGLTPLGVYALAAPFCAAASPIIGTAILQREMTAAEVGRSTLTCFLGPLGWLIAPSLFPDVVTPAGTRAGQRGNRQPPRGRNFNLPPAGAPFVRNEVLIDAGPATEAALTRLAARLGLIRLETQSFALTGRSLQRWRIDSGRPVPNVIGILARGGLAAAQPNYLYGLAQAATSQAPSPRSLQYIVEKLKLPEIHRITGGDNVTVAVIDAAIDTAHPDLAGVIVAQFDATGTPFKPHLHGTGMAGAIASHARLTGVAPKARILAVRAFADDGGSAEATTFAILKGLDWSAAQSARIVNMSFAGPSDPMMSDMLAKANARGIVLIAAVGNAGPRSPPLYPAAYPGVIGVTATDAEDKLFVQANRGLQVAVAAPGVDILVPAPGAGYQVTSGTSVAAAHVSGIAALLLARKPDLKGVEIRRILTETARSAGPSRRSPEFGAGLVDPLGAVTAVK